MSNRTVIRTVITPRAITRRVGPAGAGGGATTFAALTDKATADLLVNTPLASALSGKQPLDADLTAIAALTTTANGRALLTSANALTIGASASVSGTNTGDQDLSGLLPRLSRITVSGTTPAFPGPLVEQLSLLNGKRQWVGTDSSVEFDGYDWVVQYSDGVANYYASYNDPTTDEPWKIPPATWGISTGTGQPALNIDPPTLVPVTPFTGTIALAADQYGRLSPTDMIDLGFYVSDALAVAADTNGGFLTAGTGGTLPITRGGTGATTAGLARTALGSGATGDELFTAASPAAARETALNEILKYASTAAPTETNPSAQVTDVTLSGINLTAGIWEISFYFAFDTGACGVIPRFLFGTPASVDAPTSSVSGYFTRGTQGPAGIVYNAAAGVAATGASGGSLANWIIAGHGVYKITGSTTLAMQYIRNSESAGATIIRRAGAFLRARKING